MVLSIILRKLPSHNGEISIMLYKLEFDFTYLTGIDSNNNGTCL